MSYYGYMYVRMSTCVDVSQNSILKGYNIGSSGTKKRYKNLFPNPWLLIN
jgi:hypothetical protein